MAKIKLTDNEVSYINDLDKMIAQTQAMRLGALQLCIRSRDLQGNYKYENGFLIPEEET